MPPFVLVGKGRYKYPLVRQTSARLFTRVQVVQTLANNGVLVMLYPIRHQGLVSLAIGSLADKHIKAAHKSLLLHFLAACLSTCAYGLDQMDSFQLN